VSATMQALFGQQLHFAPQLFSRKDLSAATKIRQICQISEEYCFSHLFVTRMRDRECLRKNPQNSDGLLTTRASSMTATGSPKSSNSASTPISRVDDWWPCFQIGRRSAFLYMPIIRRANTSPRGRAHFLNSYL
jgi:hypothetical protein